MEATLLLQWQSFSKATRLLWYYLVVFLLDGKQTVLVKVFPEPLLFERGIRGALRICIEKLSQVFCFYWGPGAM
jgi:hypothetical protein